MREEHLQSATYAAVAFVVPQSVDLVLPAFRIGDLPYTVLVIVVIAGFPIALALGWIYDITARGIRRSDGDDSPDHERSP